MEKSMAFSDDRAQLQAPVTERDHADGAADARVTLVEYGDYECPYCGRAHPIIKEVQRRLGDRLRFVFRNFPLTEAHAHAQHAAEAAEAAASQGRFWAMHDSLLEHQRALADSHLLEYAKAIGLDVAQFQQALDSHVHARRVRADFLGGVRSGVNGTPTFFINDLRYDDGLDADSLVSALEAAMPVSHRR